MAEAAMRRDYRGLSHDRGLRVLCAPSGVGYRAKARGLWHRCLPHLFTGLKTTAMGMKTVQEVYNEYLAWCKDTGSTLTFEDYLWKICS